MKLNSMCVAAWLGQLQLFQLKNHVKKNRFSLQLLVKGPSMVPPSQCSPLGAASVWRPPTAGATGAAFLQHSAVPAFVDLTGAGESSEDERSAKQQRPAKKPAAAAARCHGLSRSDARPSKATEELRPDTIVVRGEGGAAGEQAGERVKRRPSFQIPPPAARSCLPGSQEKESGGVRNAERRAAPKKAAAPKNGAGRRGASMELARLSFACPGAKLTSPAGGKRKRNQLGATAVTPLHHDPLRPRAADLN